MAVAREPAYVGWTDGARNLVERAVARHGGWALWQRLSAIEVTTHSLGGPLPWIKGLGSTFARPGRTRVFPGEFRALMELPGQLGLFDRGRVALITASMADADVWRALDGVPDHRPSFAGWRKNRRWSPTDALYFFGYALSTYLALPFVLPSMPLASATGSSVTVEFPDEMPSHSKRQTFHFDATGLLERHDYVADVVGPWAHGAHFSTDYLEVEGLPLARARTVYARLGSWVSPLLVLHARLGDFRVELRE